MAQVDTKYINAVANLEDYVSQAGGTLKRVSGELRGCCPLHGGDNPTAFVVWPSSQRWMCYSRDCGSGDAISFVQKWKGLGFLEACEFITGKKIVNTDNVEQIKKAYVERKEEEEKSREDVARQILIKMREEEVYKKYYLSPERKEIWEAQGIPDVWQAVWRLGYCPDLYVWSRQVGEWHTPTLVIPVFGYKYALINIRHRLISQPANGDKYRPHYKGLPGSIFVCSPNLTKPKATIVVEGEKKAMVTCLTLGERDVQVLGVPGKEVDFATIVKSIYHFAPLYICYDPDGQNKAQELADKFDESYVFELPDKIDDMINDGRITRNILREKLLAVPRYKKGEKEKVKEKSPELFVM